MDFFMQVPWKGTPPQNAPDLAQKQAVNLQKQRTDFPEIFYMTILAVQARNKFQLETPWGSTVGDVGCVDHKLIGYLKVGMCVAVRYSRVDPNECYIRSLAPVKTGQPSAES